MFIALIQIFMSAATASFAAGYHFRHRNNALHRKLMLLGLLLTVGIAVVLVVGVHVFDATYGPAPWLVDLAGGEEGARVVLVLHRIFASVTLVLLLVQVVTGIRRLPLHRRLYKVVVPAWLVSYATGMVIFT